MAKHVVVTMPGDGIGKVVLPEALRVLSAVPFSAKLKRGGSNSPQTLPSAIQSSRSAS